MTQGFVCHHLTLLSRVSQFRIGSRGCPTLPAPPSPVPRMAGRRTCLGDVAGMRCGMGDVPGVSRMLRVRRCMSLRMCCRVPRRFRAVMRHGTGLRAACRSGVLRLPDHRRGMAPRHGYRFVETRGVVPGDNGPSAVRCCGTAVAVHGHRTTVPPARAGCRAPPAVGLYRAPCPIRTMLL